MYVHKYMSKNVATIAGDSPIHMAQRQMQEGGIHHLPVVDETGKLIGLLSNSKLRKIVALLASSLTSGELQEPLMNTKVKDVMSKNVITIFPDAPLAEAGALGVKHRIGALPVINEDKEIVGIITTTDLINAQIQMLRVDEPGELFNFAGSLDQVKLSEIIQIVYKHRARIRALFCSYPPQSKEEDWYLHIDVEDVIPIKEELKARGYAYSLAGH